MHHAYAIVLGSWDQITGAAAGGAVIGTTAEPNAAAFFTSEEWSGRVLRIIKGCQEAKNASKLKSSLPLSKTDFI